ncbi:hypothetical protein [Enterococcus alishanensis]|uniref:DUF2975 domain-containing protein n=1 Tax=Enterococcus alishanensis TaxID=1303817 RepID=A0ABS6T8V2_9ENTE|nr:hypothetical protein [Enterococcus alishanensis]MBV7389329.1 hypothetical protein [Enterococcus alishanensis]
MKKVTIFILTMVFFVMQLAMGLSIFHFLIQLFSIPFQGLPEVTGDSLVLVGVDFGGKSYSPINELILTVFFVLAFILLCITQFLLAGSFRHLLENINDGKPFSDNSILSIKRILFRYLMLIVMTFLIETMLHFLGGQIISTSIPSFWENLINSVFQLAGIYTLYIVFKEGSRIRQENEEIV